MKDLLNLLSKYIYFENRRKIHYLKILDHFIIWSGISKFDEFMQIDRNLVIKYKIEKGFESTTSEYKILVTTVNHIFKNLFEEGKSENLNKLIGVITDVSFDSTREREQIRVIQRKTILSQTFLNILDQIDFSDYDNRTKDVQIIRNKLLIKFVYLFSLQSKEIVNLRWINLHKNGDYYSIHIETGRGNRETDICKLKSTKIIDEIDLYQRSLKDLNFKSEYIFVSLGFRTLGKKMSSKGVNDICKKLSIEIGDDVSIIKLRNLSNNHIFLNESVNDYLKPIIREKFFKCKKCNKLIKWKNNIVCEDCIGISDKEEIGSGFVYFIKTIGHDFVKIGISHSNLQNRLMTNQVGNMYDLEMLGYIESNKFKNIESDFHTNFRKKHMRGEWFNLNKKEVFDMMNKLDYNKFFKSNND